MVYKLVTYVASLNGLPAAITSNLEKLEQLDADKLRIILVETVPTKTQKQIGELLQKQRAVALTKAEQMQLARLRQQADLVMLRKACAAALLHIRGHHLPTLAEVHNQTSCN